MTYDAQRLGFDLALKQQRGPRRAGSPARSRCGREQREASLVDLTVTLGRLPWRLAPRPRRRSSPGPTQQIAVTPLDVRRRQQRRAHRRLRHLAHRRQRRAARDGDRIVFLDTLQAAFERPTRYGGMLDLDATIRGTRERPEASGTRDGHQRPRRARQLPEAAGARSPTPAQMFDVDARLDQAPGVWITAAGKLPLGLMTRRQPGAADRPHHQVEHDQPRPDRRDHRRRPQRERRHHARREGDRHEPRSALRRPRRDRQRRRFSSCRPARRTRTRAPR